MLAADDAERTRLQHLLGGREGEWEHIDADWRSFYDAKGVRQGMLREPLQPIFESLAFELGTNEGKHEFGTVHYLDVLGVRAAANTHRSSTRRAALRRSSYVTISRLGCAVNALRRSSSVNLPGSRPTITVSFGL